VPPTALAEHATGLPRVAVVGQVALIWRAAPITTEMFWVAVTALPSLAVTVIVLVPAVA